MYRKPRTRLASPAQRFRRPSLLVLAVAVTAIVATYAPGHVTNAQGQGPCAPPYSNSIVCENQLPGNPHTEWDIAGAGDPTIQGFTTDISVNRGQTVSFKITTDATNYRLDIYRLGYYGGLGARKVATVLPSVPLPQVQPDCLADWTTGLVDCGNWGVSATWVVPASATSGIYVAKAVRLDTGGASHVVFIVRRDNSASDILLQADDTTWQAYNRYGGNSLYMGSPAGRAYKVSYNRPFNNRADPGGYGQPNWVFWGLYPKLRWLEANGFDVSYISGVDADRYGSQLLGHRVFMTVGHDEVLVESPAVERRGGPRRRCSPGVFQWKFPLLEDTLRAINRRQQHRLPHACLLQGNTRRRQDRPFLGMDRHVAGPSVQPALGRRAAGECSCWHDLRRQSRTRRPGWHTDPGARRRGKSTLVA